jgi:hypothetical protein
MDSVLIRDNFQITVLKLLHLKLRASLKSMTEMYYITSELLHKDYVKM